MATRLSAHLQPSPTPRHPKSSRQGALFPAWLDNDLGVRMAPLKVAVNGDTSFPSLGPTQTTLPVGAQQPARRNNLSISNKEQRTPHEYTSAAVNATSNAVLNLMTVNRYLI